MDEVTVIWIVSVVYFSGALFLAFQVGRLEDDEWTTTSPERLLLKSLGWPVVIPITLAFFLGQKFPWKVEKK